MPPPAGHSAFDDARARGTGSLSGAVALIVVAAVNRKPGRYLGV